MSAAPKTRRREGAKPPEDVSMRLTQEEARNAILRDKSFVEAYAENTYFVLTSIVAGIDDSDGRVAGLLTSPRGLEPGPDIPKITKSCFVELIKDGIVGIVGNSAAWINPPTNRKDSRVYNEFYIRRDRAAPIVRPDHMALGFEKLEDMLSVGDDDKINDMRIEYEFFEMLAETMHPVTQQPYRTVTSDKELTDVQQEAALTVLEEVLTQKYGWQNMMHDNGEPVIEIFVRNGQLVEQLIVAGVGSLRCSDGNIVFTGVVLTGDADFEGTVELLLKMTPREWNAYKTTCRSRKEDPAEPISRLIRMYIGEHLPR